MSARLWHERYAVGFLPIAMAVILFLPYGLSQHYLLSCNSKYAGCRGFAVDTLFVAETASAVNTVALPAFADTGAMRVRRLGVAARRYEGRLLWTFFIGISTLVYAAGIGVGIFLLRAAPSARGRVSGYLAGMSLLAVTTALLFVLCPNSHMIIMHPVLQDTVANKHVLLGMPLSGAFMNWFNSATYGVTLFLLLACGVLIAPERDPTPVQDAKQLTTALDAIAAHMRYLRAFLYVGTILLVVGVLRMNAVFTWAYSFLTPADAAALQPIRMTAVSILGAFYSLLLAAVYVPSAYVLRERAASLITLSGALPEAKKVESARSDITLSFADAFPRILAIVAPLLTGPVGELLGRLSSSR